MGDKKNDDETPQTVMKSSTIDNIHEIKNSRNLEERSVPQKTIKKGA
jgi:hypothetical protein